MIVVVFGVSGVGKTTVGKVLAQNLGWEFYEADDFHPPANLEKMKNAIPLTDEDRRPWLARLRQLIEGCLAAQKNAVLACSALKRAYRDQLRVSEQVSFVFLRASRARVVEHFRQRHDHFMPVTLLDSQFADLEEPKPEERALTIDVTGSPDDLSSLIKSKLLLQT